MVRDQTNGLWGTLVRLLSTTQTKVTVLCGVYIPMLVDNFSSHPTSPTDKSNSNNKKLEELT